MGAFIGSTEFYIMASLAAAAVVALCMKPAPRSAVTEELLAGKLIDTDTDTDTDTGQHTSPTIIISCSGTDQSVAITRAGLVGLRTDSAVSLALTRTGSDITIKERITPSKSIAAQPVNTAIFSVPSLPPGHYHVTYHSDSTGLFAAFTLSIRPENVIVQPLKL